MTIPRALFSFSSDSSRRARVSNLRRVGAPLLLVLLVALTAGAQDKKNDLQLRTVHGAVLDRDENPVPSSVVYLKNVKSQGVKTYIADDTGHYRFSGLDPNVDYEVHAEHNELMSPTRTVSSFDSRRDMDVPLKLTKKKPDH
ncbi:MAG: carboxypeptidase-like regulatory domain-containing protein [Candidatus Acidiferrales bacterium]